MPSLSLDLESGDGESAERKPRPKPTVPEYLREPRAQTGVVDGCRGGGAGGLRRCGGAETVWPIRAGDSLWQDAGARGRYRGGAAEGIGERSRERREGRGDGGANRGNRGQDDRARQRVWGGDCEEAIRRKTLRRRSENLRRKPVKPTAPPADLAAAAKNGTKTTAKPETPPKPDKGTAAEPKAVRPKAIEPQAPTVPTAKPPVEPAPKGDGGAQKETAVEPAPPEPLGQLLSSDQVLLSNNPTSGWTRVGANQMLVPQQLLALPTYRAKVVLTAGVALEILGGTRVELLGSSPQELPGIRVLYGRVVLMPLAKAGTRLRVAFGDHAGTITFVDAESIAALEVHNLPAPGTNPEDDPAARRG